MTPVDQLGLFEPPTEPELVFVATCFTCGAVLDRVPVDGGPGAPWYAASLWCYVAQCAHDRAHHPERAAQRGDTPPH